MEVVPALRLGEPRVNLWRRFCELSVGGRDDHHHPFLDEPAELGVTERRSKKSARKVRTTRIRERASEASFTREAMNSRRVCSSAVGENGSSGRR